MTHTWKTHRAKPQVAAAQRLSTDHRIEESRFFKVFTKLRALEQTDFEKVLVMDIDLLVAGSIVSASSFHFVKQVAIA